MGWFQAKNKVLRFSGEPVLRRYSQAQNMDSMSRMSGEIQALFAPKILGDTAPKRALHKAPKNGRVVRGRDTHSTKKVAVQVFGGIGRVQAFERTGHSRSRSKANRTISQLRCSWWYANVIQCESKFGIRKSIVLSGARLRHFALGGRERMDNLLKAFEWT